MTSDANQRQESNGRDFYEPLGKTLPVAEQFQGFMLRRARTSILQALKTAEAHVILDVCCGSGCLACRLSVSGFEVTGIDSSPTMLKRAETKHRASRFLCCDASHMPFSGEFDAAVISLALHEMKTSLRESVWKAMRRAVKPGGLLIALDFTVPRGSTWYARTMSRLIDKDEKQIGGVNPAHYENFREFMSRGGLEGWLRTHERNDVTVRYHAGGNLGVFSVAA